MLFCRKLLFVYAFVLIAALISGCGNKEKVSLEYAEEYVRVFSPCSDGWLVDNNLDTTTYQNNSYYFEDDIAEPTRISYVLNQQKICDFLRESGITVENVNFYIISNVESYAVANNHSVYIDVSKIGTYTQVELTLSVLMGEYTNYGYIYALSNYICGQLSWKNDSSTPVNIDVLGNNPYLFNLNYPCFQDGYATADEIASVRGLALLALQEMESPFDGEVVFQAAVDKYARENSLSYHKTYLTFAFGGNNCPLRIKTNYLDIYLDSDYEGSCTLTEQSKMDDPMFNLDAMIEFFEYVDTDLAALREKFGYDKQTLIPVYIQTINMKFIDGSAYGGLFELTDGGQIRMADIYTISHEYTHFLDFCLDKQSSDDEKWCSEVIACYFGKSMNYIERLVRANSGDPDVWTVELLSQLIGQPYDSVEDEIMFQNIVTAYTDNPKYSVDVEYTGRLSFGYYFVETYGEEAFVQCMLSPKQSKIIIGIEMDKVVDDWCVWLEQFKILD